MMRRIWGKQKYPRIERRRSCQVKINCIKREDKARVFYRYRKPLVELGEGNSKQESVSLVLLGGWSTHPAVYLSQLKAFSGRYRILTMETRGYWQGSGLGKSKPKTYLDDCVGDLKAIMETEGIERSVIVGHSMGGAIAMKLYHRYQCCVLGLVLVSPGYVDPRKLSFVQGRRYLHKPADLLFHSASAVPAINFLKRHILSRTYLNQGLLSIIMMAAFMDEAQNGIHAKKMIKKVMRADMRAMGVSMRALFRMDDSLLENAKDIDVPTLLIGGREDPLISADSVVRLGNRIPEGEVEIWDDVKHFPMLSAPERFNRRLAQFLEKLSCT
jgi:pimeloyl-ACP methyl ester carboxylesterase